MTRPDPYGLVVIAGSAGAIGPLRQILSALPADYPLPVVVVQHRSARPRDLLPDLLARWCALPVQGVSAGERITPGAVYVARPDLHLVVNSDRTFGLEDGRRVKSLLSSANLLLTTAAAVLGPVIGVVLSGSGSDATDGVQAVKAAGGTVVVQDEATAEYFDMPRAAIASGAVDRVLPVERIGPLLAELGSRERPTPYWKEPA
jgi:Chemotaxis response regulator containing a CheY-like receiver domain and a methylesterase domain